MLVRTINAEYFPEVSPLQHTFIDGGGSPEASEAVWECPWSLHVKWSMMTLFLSLCNQKWCHKSLNRNSPDYMNNCAYTSSEPVQFLTHRLLVKLRIYFIKHILIFLRIITLRNLSIIFGLSV